jgi:cytochrome c oxidase assembly protein subunit 15
MLDYQPQLPKTSPWPHRLAVLTCCATFPLICMGGLVTSHQAGMSVPDWPNSFGYNMFLFPPHLWIGGIFYEHTHRLMGTVVGFLSILLALAAWKWEFRPVARRLAYAVLAGVIFQGILGGLRVVFVNLNLAIVHACVAQAFFCLTVLVAFLTSSARPSSLIPHPSSVITTRTLALIAVSLIYLQLIAGALMRHYQAGLAIPDLPLAYGHILPPTTSEQLREINHLRVADPTLDRVTLGQIYLHYAHRVGALLVTLALATLITHVLLRHRQTPQFRNPALLLILLIISQLTLGVFVVLKRKPADIASLHVAVGALTLVTTFLLYLRARRACAHFDVRRSMLDVRCSAPSSIFHPPSSILSKAHA